MRITIIKTSVHLRIYDRKRNIIYFNMLFLTHIYFFVPSNSLMFNVCGPNLNSGSKENIL